MAVDWSRVRAILDGVASSAVEDYVAVTKIRGHLRMTEGLRPLLLQYSQKQIDLAETLEAIRASLTLLFYLTVTQIEEKMAQAEIILRQDLRSASVDRRVYEMKKAMTLPDRVIWVVDGVKNHYISVEIAVSLLEQFN